MRHHRSLAVTSVIPCGSFVCRPIVSLYDSIGELIVHESYVPLASLFGRCKLDRSDPDTMISGSSTLLPLCFRGHPQAVSEKQFNTYKSTYKEYDEIDGRRAVKRQRRKRLFERLQKACTHPGLADESTSEDVHLSGKLVVLENLLSR